MMNPELIEYTLRSYPRFPRYRYYPKFRLATSHPVGVLTDAVADQVSEFVEMQEHDQDELFDRYTDFSGLTKIRLKVKHMFDIACRRRRAREPVNSRFFADQPVTFSIAKMYEGLMERAMITARVFEKREAAAEWLDVPLQILYPPSKKK